MLGACRAQRDGYGGAAGGRSRTPIAPDPPTKLQRKALLRPASAFRSRMSAVSTQKWHEHAHRNMAEPQLAHQGALDQAEGSVRTHEGTLNDNHDMYKEVHDSTEQKVSDTRRLVENLTDRAYGLEISIQHTRESQGQLEAALRAKDAPLQLCLWRLEQRSKRPPHEQVRDVVELALEEEKATLIQTKWDLRDAIERTKAMINEMENRLAEVRDDLHHKQHALGIDEMCLAKAQSSYHTMAFRTPRPQGPTLGVKTAGSKRQSGLFPHVEAHNYEVFRQNRTGQLECHAASHDEAADVLREQNTRLVARCEKAANDECLQMRMRLENQIRETESEIDHTNGIISETRFHMGALQKPLAAQQAGPRVAWPEDDPRAAWPHAAAGGGAVAAATTAAAAAAWQQGCNLG